MRDVQAALRAVWPNGRHELALRAALLDGAEAVASWEEFTGRFGLDGLEEGEFRLLPLVWSNLHRHEYRGSTMAQLKSVHRQAWYKSQMLTHRLCAALRGLEGEGIPTALMKGAPLAYLYYDDPALRPMRDSDVLVPAEHVDRAVAWLDRSGWRRLAPETSELMLRRYRRFGQEVTYYNEHGEQLDLHWHALYWARSRGVDEALWRLAEPMDLKGTATRTLSASFHLVHACVHGAMWNRVAPIRWVADATMLLRRAAIDWDWVERFAREQLLVLYLLPAFTYLKDRMGAAIPEEMLARWGAMEFARRDWAEFQHVTRPGAAQGLVDLTLALYRLHERGGLDRAAAYRAVTFAGYLGFLFNVTETRSLGERWDRAWRWVRKRARGGLAREGGELRVMGHAPVAR